MKTIFLGLALIIANVSAYAQTASSWTVDPSHSNVKFSVTHMVVSEVEGAFKTYDGKVTTTNADFNNATIVFTVDVNSINMDNADREKHLKGDDFFNAEKYPKMTFKSVSFKKIKDKQYILEGDLTIRDVTKRVKFNVTYGGTATDPWGNVKAGFKANTTINRKDFGLKWSTMTEAGGMVVSDEVAIQLNIELLKGK